MKKIGLVTFWDYNYGSSLQCYATKNVVQSLGYKCDLIEEKRDTRQARIIILIKKLLSLPFKCLRYPSYFKAYLGMRRNGKVAKGSLSGKTKELIHFFGVTELQPRRLSKKRMKLSGEDESYSAFIVGSDQVWGGHFVEQPYGNFLEFAPKEKKIAYAVSFGSEEISKYNIAKYKKQIKKFDKITVREESGVRIIKDLIGKDVEIMPDPTILLTVNEWSSLAEKSNKVPDEPYIFAHFLDDLSENAVNIIKKCSQEKNLKIVCLGWDRSELTSLENAVFMDGDPKDYVALIKNARYVYTDSFHTTLFSLRFKRQFYTFARNYAHKFSQHTRIENLLKNCKCSDRYIDSSAEASVALTTYDVDCSEFFEKEREKGLSFLKESIKGTIEDKKKSYERLKDIDCCGCGACAEKCPKGAIQMVPDDFGCLIPQISEEKCIDCGLCDKVCNLKVNYDTINRKGFIAYASDRDLLNKSASGGAFSTVAKRFIENGGVVYGAAFEYGEDIIVKHKSARTLDELYPLLNSKYVQSNMSSSFKSIQEDLKNGEKVLFGGTSCQVDALYRWFGKRPENLYTADLVCHGVPGGKLLSDYIHLLEKKNKSKAVNVSFKEKDNGEIRYIERITYANGKETAKDSMQSVYYKMFFNSDSYRSSCYNCPYSTVNKPADVTLGDYFECKNDYPQLFSDGGLLQDVKAISCIIVQNSKGMELIEKTKDELKTIEADVNRIQYSHNQLCYPSIPSDKREKYMKVYKNRGIKGLHNYNKRNEAILWLPNMAKNILKSLIGRFL